MPDIKPFNVNVNGKTQKVNATPDMPLLWVLRQELGLAGPKFGCGAGLCGACTVHIDGQPMRACQMPIGNLGQSRITTIEGLQGEPLFERLRKAWLDIDVIQCGYCQGGQLMSAHALLRSSPHPDDATIDGAMEGNICRCATYPRIREAIRNVAGEVGHAG